MKAGGPPIDQEEINVELPRALFGGLKRRPTEELLRCVARDYADLELENRRLRRELEELRAQEAAPPADPEPSLALAERERSAPATLDAGVWAPDEKDATVPVAELPPAPVSALPDRARADAALEPREPRHDDELARTLLALAQRSARETREATRRECDLIIKKVRERAEQLERDLERETRSANAELDELQTLRFELREQMRASLTSLLRTCSGDGVGVFPLDLSGELGGYDLDDPRAHKSKKKSKT